MKAENTDEMYTFIATSKVLSARSRTSAGSMSARQKVPRPRSDRAADVGTYEHKTKSYGRIAFPVFTVVGWTTRTDLDASDPPADYFDDGIPEFGPSKG